MNTRALLLELLRNGAQLWVEGDELCLEAAEGILTPAMREELSRRKPEIISLLGQRSRYALPSFAQQRLWLLDQLEPGNTSYNMPQKIQLKGILDVGALRKALSTIVAGQSGADAGPADISRAL